MMLGLAANAENFEKVVKIKIIKIGRKISLNIGD